jgi:PIN domain nuclease of toxin-antitoxin system
MILLDTCCILWLATDPSKLSANARDALQEHRDGLFVSSISAWEVAIKNRSGKLELPLGPEEWFRAVLLRYQLTPVSIDWRIAVYSVSLPRIHEDPCDRHIIATAQLRGFTIVTADQTIPQYPDVAVIW